MNKRATNGCQLNPAQLFARDRAWYTAAMTRVWTARGCLRTVSLALELGLIGALALGTSGCRREGGGARIAEPDEGPWRWVCTAEIDGPDRIGERHEAQAMHSARAEARRQALVAACSKGEAGGPCNSETGGWSVEDETCGRVDDDAGRRRFRCELVVERAAGPRHALARAEGLTEDKACERATKQACREVGGGAACRAMSPGWTQARAMARYRP